MSLQVEKLEKNMAKLTIEVSAEDMEKAVEKAYQKNKGQISIPGFRKGKVPRAMVEKMYGKGIFLEEAANSVIPSAYEKALDECVEEIVSSPEIEVVELVPEKPFIFTALVALKPEVELGKYKGVKIEKADTEVTEEDITKEIDRERESNARTITVEDRAVKDGDMTVIDFEGFVDGEAFEGGKGENYPLTIGSGAFIPGFEEQVVGANLDTEIDVNVTFPEDYHAEDLAGKAAVFKVTVKEIKEKQLPELDDVKKKLAEKKEAEAKSAKESKVIEAIVEDSKMEIPDAMVSTTQRQMVDEFAQRIQMQGLSIEQYFQFTGLTPEKMMEQVKPQAEARIKSRLVLEAVVKAENIEATEEDFQKELERMADVYQMEADKIKEMVGENGKKEIMKDLAVAKAAEFVVENAVEE